MIIEIILKMTYLRDTDKYCSEGWSHQALPQQGNQVALGGIVDHVLKLFSFLPKLHQLPEG